MGLKNSTFNQFRWGIWWFTNGCIFWTNRDRSVPRMVPIVEEASVLVVRGLDQNPSIIPLPICSMVLETSYEHVQQTSPSFVGTYGAYMEHLGYTGWFIEMETSSTCFEHCKHVRLAAINPKMADFAVLSLCSYTSPSMILFMRWEKQTHKTQCVCIFFRLTTSDDSVIPFIFPLFSIGYQWDPRWVSPQWIFDRWPTTSSSAWYCWVLWIGKTSMPCKWREARGTGGSP